MKDLNYFRQKWQKAVKANRILLILLIGAILMAVGLGIACNIAKSAIYVDVGAPVITEVIEEPIATTGPTLEPTLEPTAEPETTPEPEPQWYPDEESIIALAQTLWGECRGVPSTMRKAAVAWCVLNRVDDPRWSNTVLGVVSAPDQFKGYSNTYPVTETLRALAIDVLLRWHAEHEGAQDVGRVLPIDYCYFIGDGEENHFTNVWRSDNYWTWELPDPYKEDQ